MPVNPSCPECGFVMEARTGKNGPFWGCSRYPKCKCTRSIPTASPLATRQVEMSTPVVSGPVEHMLREEPKQFKIKLLVVIAGAIIGLMGTALPFACSPKGSKSTEEQSPSSDSRPSPSHSQKSTSLMSLKEKQAFAKGIKHENYPDCPKCGKQMVIRQNRTTKEPFFGCRDYPNCKGTRKIDYMIQGD
jgi:ssDNA-binding Zn-finger/Zn-ribbon topoisomerase 1